MSVLRFENVSYSYGLNTAFEKQALKDINIVIDSNSCVGLIGHTGSGKSTLIQHMNGLLKPTAGSVYWNDINIEAADFNRKALCAKVGLVFQYPEYQLFEMTVLKDVCFGPRNLGLSEDEAIQAAKKAISMVGLDESCYEVSPFDLSGGQKRRVAIAGVLAMNPEVLVLDEPAAGLDPCSKKDILDMIYRLHLETGMTVVLSSHSMEDMASYAKRLIVMNQGEIVRDGSPREIFEDYRYLESIGLSAPQMTYMVQKLRELGYNIPSDLCSVEEVSEAIYGLWKKCGEKTL